MSRGRIAKQKQMLYDTGGGDHHPWASRDYLDIDCKATGCKWNLNERCLVPSRCEIGPDGRCNGFQARETPKQIDGD